MPTVGRPPGPDPTLVVRPGGDASIGSHSPPEDLLPPGGVSATAPAPDPHRALALDALRVLRVLRGLGDRPRGAGSWEEPAFAREVELVRGHLAPIRSRCGLTSSFGREASFTRPLRVAYALRWLELGDGVARPRWIDLVTARD
jgi:hypothetical protein